MYKHKPFLNSDYRKKINHLTLENEDIVIKTLLDRTDLSAIALQNIYFRAHDLVEQVRESKNQQGTMEAFIQEYDLSTTEGTVLMCLAEALLRIPDKETMDRLIKDKLSPADWKKHLGHSHSLFVNASTWGLMLGGKLLQKFSSENQALEIANQMLHRIGEPILRAALKQAMQIMGTQFVMETNINAALKRSQKEFHKHYRFSYDMLGEAALSTRDSEKYFADYRNALDALGERRKHFNSLYEAPSLSIKLSALHPRYEVAQYQRVMQELLPKLLTLAKTARQLDVGLTIDAEEADRLDISLDLFSAVLNDPSVAGWNGFGLAVQAYQKRAYAVLEWLKQQAETRQIRIPVRLVKGAYWDTEIKRAQEKGLKDYPVFTRKVNTDISYIACASFMLKNSAHFYPQFATHNAHTIATILELARDSTEFEFQRLHGMGQALYKNIIESHGCRIYSPVGGYKDLLPYLVRRLLENGANTSFVNRIENAAIPIENIIEHPGFKLDKLTSIRNPNIPLPENIYGEQRQNSKGIDLSDYAILDELITKIRIPQWQASPIISGVECSGDATPVYTPFNKQHIGTVILASEKEAANCIDLACQHAQQWKTSELSERTNIIRQFADLLEQNKYELYSLCIYEAGKTINDAIAEVREAIDFCHYYVEQANSGLMPQRLPGPTGEKNELQLHGRGAFVCISPWNFPVAIFTGQIVAAFLTGNTIIAKPSSNTTLIASFTIKLLLQAGALPQHLYFLPCKASVLEKAVLSDKRIAGVAFTGSLSTAWQINQTISQRQSTIIPMIAETGGQNAMIIDSSAFLEQVVKDVIASAFYSAGQRCSALRVLLVQQDVEQRLLDLLKLAMQELQIGSPDLLTTDIPPVIDLKAKTQLDAYKQSMKDQGKLIFELPLSETLDGYFVSPCIVSINNLIELGEEQFGPILHIMSYRANQLEQLAADINQLGFGLTLGIHSRIDENINLISRNVNIGNIYVNRNMIGAVVGVQPFGGEGLSGTGPKAGGPHYLHRFCTEKTISINTSAIGGNTELLNLDDNS